MLLTQILPVVQAFKWKMFNPDPSKKSVKRKAKRYVSLKRDNENYPSLEQVVLNDDMVLARNIQD